jgi:4'-phosphopantetheinyl transferase
MPLLFKKNYSTQTLVGVWQIDETEFFFLNQLLLSNEEQLEMALLAPRKRLEWLAVRYLLHLLLGNTERQACSKDEFGKPFLQNNPSLHISLSHSQDKVAVVVSTQRVGIDIQYITSKIERIAPKFMREEELQSLHPSTSITHLLIYWGAKEALYKVYGKKELDFKQHIFIQPFPFNLAVGKATGIVAKHDFHQTYQLDYTLVEGFVLVVAEFLMSNIKQEGYITNLHESANF